MTIERDTPTTIAWIGLGQMGGRMSAHLADAGHDVRGFDVEQASVDRAVEHGLTAASSVAEAATGASVVLLSLPKGEHVRQVLDGPDGVWAHASPGALILDTSTVDIQTSQWSHDESTARGFRFVDAPVSGGVSGAEAGTLTFMLGGTDEDVQAAVPIVEPMSGATIAVGAATHGIAAKLVNNMMLGIGLLAVSEGSQLADALGIDPKAFWEVARVSSGDSWALRTWYPVPGIVDSAPANRGFEGNFSAALHHKDLTLAVDGAHETGVNAPAGELILSQMQSLVDEGLQSLDCTLVVKYASPDGQVKGFDPSRTQQDPAEQIETTTQSGHGDRKE